MKLKTNLMCSIRENVGWVRLYVCKLFLMSSKVLMKGNIPKIVDKKCASGGLKKIKIKRLSIFMAFL